MKKFNLKVGGIKELLTKEQMKKITGGYTCSDFNFTGGPCGCRYDYNATLWWCSEFQDCGPTFICTNDGALNSSCSAIGCSS